MSTLNDNEYLKFIDYIHEDHEYQKTCILAFLDLITIDEVIQRIERFKFKYKSNNKNLDNDDYDLLVEDIVSSQSNNITTDVFLNKIKEFWLSGKYDYSNLERSSFAPYDWDYYVDYTKVLCDPLTVMLNFYPELVEDEHANEIFKISNLFIDDERFSVKFYYPFMYKKLKEFLDDGDYEFTHHKLNVEGLRRTQGRWRGSVVDLLSYHNDKNFIMQELSSTYTLYQQQSKQVKSYACKHTLQVYYNKKEWLRFKLLNNPLIELTENDKHKWMMEELCIDGEIVVRFTTLKRWVAAWDWPISTEVIHY